MNQALGRKLLVAVTIISSTWAFAAQAGEQRSLRVAAGDVQSGLLALAGNAALAISNPPNTHPCHESEKNDCAAALGITAAVQPSASAPAALDKLRSGVADLAVVPDDAAYTALMGGGARRNPAWPQLRTLATLTTRPLMFYVRGDVEVNSIAGLARWRIAVGSRGSDASTSITALLAALGLPATAYTPIYMTGSAEEMVRTNKADAVVVLGDEVAAPERNALLTGTLKLLSPGKGELERVALAYPFLGRKVIEPITGLRYATISSANVLVARADLAPQTVTALLTHMWLTKDSRVRAANDARKLFSAAQAAQNPPVPLHPAAVIFYQQNKLLEP